MDGGAIRKHKTHSGKHALEGNVASSHVETAHWVIPVTVSEGKPNEEFTQFPDWEQVSRTHHPKSQAQRLELHTDSQKVGESKSQERRSLGESDASWQASNF